MHTSNCLCTTCMRHINGYRPEEKKPHCCCWAGEHYRLCMSCPQRLARGLVDQGFKPGCPDYINGGTDDDDSFICT